MPPPVVAITASNLLFCPHCNVPIVRMCSLCSTMKSSERFMSLIDPVELSCHVNGLCCMCTLHRQQPGFQQDFQHVAGSFKRGAGTCTPCLNQGWVWNTSRRFDVAEAIPRACCFGYADADFIDIIMRVGDAVSFATAPNASSAADCFLLPKSSPPSFARFTRKTSSAMPSDR